MKMIGIFVVIPFLVPPEFTPQKFMCCFHNVRLFNFFIITFLVKIIKFGVVIVDSAIKRFEICFDLAWKSIKYSAKKQGTEC